MNLDEALHEHLKALNPTTQRAAINQAQDTLNRLLRELIDPPGEVRLGGSVSRGTAIPPIKDVDLLFVLSRVKVPAPQSQNPGQLMTELQREMEQKLRLPVRVQNRSLALEWQGLPFDVVPCWKEDGQPADVLRLPDLSRSRWLCTSPERHRKLSNEADQRAGGKLLPLVRGVKAWKRKVGLRLPSFYLEAMCWGCLSGPPRSWAAGLQQVFSGLADRVTGGFSDPTGLGARVDEGVDAATRALAERSLRAAAVEALRLSEAPDPARAVEALLGPRPR